MTILLHDTLEENLIRLIFENLARDEDLETQVHFLKIS